VSGVPLGWSILVLVVYALACARVTRLINSDTILDAPRLAIARRAHDDDSSPAERRRWSTALYFVQCPWCVGFWVCLVSAVVPVLVIEWPWWALLPVALAASHLIGVFAFAADTEDVEITDVEVD
jgi:hypothetical protein